MTGSGGGVAFRGFVNKQSDGDAVVGAPRAGEPHAAMTKTTRIDAAIASAPLQAGIAVVPPVSRWYD